MTGITVSDLVPVLQTAIGPVVLVSGVGLLILSMTNRLSRIIDRGRSLVRELPKATDGGRERIQAQVDSLTHRARMLQRAITLAVFSVLFAAILVIVLFLTAAFHFEDAYLIGFLFVGAMASLIFSLVAFIQELNQSLTAFKLDIGKWPEEK
jgi:predicted neutral ceramidase superfamily lipid hydrolase